PRPGAAAGGSTPGARGAAREPAGCHHTHRPHRTALRPAAHHARAGDQRTRTAVDQRTHPDRESITRRTPMTDQKVRVAIVGVGNCASSLVQGVEYYKDAAIDSTVPGLMHVKFGDYHVRDVEFVAAFDVDGKKVGMDLADAILASENNTMKLCDVPPTGVTVQRGPTIDGLGKYYRETIEESAAEPVDVVQKIGRAHVDVVVSYLPVGSEEADKFYAQCCIDAGV